MADEKKPTGDKPASPTSDPLTEAIWIIFSILIFLYALNSVVSFFNASNLFSSGWRSFTPKGLVLSSTRPISALLNPIGSKFVVTSSSADLLDSPNGKKIGTKHLGDKGTIVGGPVIVQGEKYWKVKFEDGSEGWMKEKDIANLPQKVTPLSEMQTLIGSPVETSKETAVFASPGENQIATMPVGSKATVIEGPIIKDGVKYWHVRFDDGTEGWVNEESLDSLLDGKRTPLSKMPTLIGGSVSTSKNGTPLYDSPGGNQIGTLNKGSFGKIIEGPMVVNGVKYWHVKFDNGEEGWVSENDLYYVENIKPSVLIKIFNLFWKFVSVFKYVLLLLCIMAIFGIIYLYKKIVALRKSERELLYPKGVPHHVEEVVLINTEWERILKYLASTNQNDWRHAILESDIILNKLLDDMHLPGDTMGEKLKAVERADFTSIDNAWEAHKFRNSIAHEGSSFMINENQVKRVLSLYQSVFEEFGIIEKHK